MSKDKGKDANNKENRERSEERLSGAKQASPYDRSSWVVMNCNLT